MNVNPPNGPKVKRAQQEKSNNVSFVLHNIKNQSDNMALEIRFVRMLKNMRPKTPTPNLIGASQLR